MINVLGWKVFIGLVAVITIGCGAAAFPFNSPDNLLQFLGLFSKAGLVLGIAILGIGQSPAFPLLCRAWPLNLLVPDIHGEWRGSISSNWPVIAEKHGIRDVDGQPFTDRRTPVTVDICVKLFSVSIELKSDSRYQKSQTVSCALRRNSHRGFELSYIYRSTVPDPKQSDEQTFLGAGFIDFPSRTPRELNGVYWSNRNWQKGLNTAGTIDLKRV